MKDREDRVLSASFCCGCFPLFLLSVFYHRELLGFCAFLLCTTNLIATWLIIYWVADMYDSNDIVMSIPGSIQVSGPFEPPSNVQSSVFRILS